MLTIKEILELKDQGKNREIIAGVPRNELHYGNKEDDEKLLEVGWAHHQLGEYTNSLDIMWVLSDAYPPTSVIGESSLRGCAHGILQEEGNVERADALMKQIPQSLVRDNVRMDIMTKAARKGIKISALDIIFTISKALTQIPLVTINGHVINNGCLALHEAREQEGVKPYLALLPGLIEIAIGIYEETSSTKNHLAGACYRGSLIFTAAGPSWYKGAELLALASCGLWKELIESQGVERFQRNLEGAEKQLKEIQELLSKE
ncbi:MAG: hypothetical protein ABH831_02615 [Candidatus Nealsonbacteria bacterium]